MTRFVHSYILVLIFITTLLINFSAQRSISEVSNLNALRNLNSATLNNGDLVFVASPPGPPFEFKSGNKTQIIGIQEPLNDAPTTKYFQRIYSGTIDIRWCDAVTGTNCASAITAALGVANHVIIPDGEGGNWVVDTMIELGSNQTLELQSGAYLVRESASSLSTDPVVWMKGTGCVLKGAGPIASQIVSENRSPRGVVRLGHADMTSSHGNVNWCTLKDLSIAGNTDYGQTTGEGDSAVYMANPQFSGFTSYFHNLTNLRVSRANYGVRMQGWANANTIYGIQGYRIGNVTHTALGEPNAMFAMEGSLDNTIGLSFFHQSSNTTMVFVDEYDNTANLGGIVHTPFANTITGMVAEQGGASALGIDVRAGSKCHYEIRHNTAGGNSVYDGFEQDNTFIGLGGQYQFGIHQRQTTKSTDAGNPIARTKGIEYINLTENTTYKVLELSLSKQTGALIQIDFRTNSAASIGFEGAGTVTYQCQRNASGTTTATAILSRYTGDLTPCIPQISGSTVTIPFKVANNGTSTSVVDLRADIKIMSDNVATFYDTATTTSTGTPLGSNI